jgi:hypothetical protein
MSYTDGGRSLLAKLLVIPNYSQALKARSFEELWRSLSNDQITDLYFLFKSAHGRAFAMPLKDAAPEDWGLVRDMLLALGNVVCQLNATISTVDWSDTITMSRLLEQARQEASAAKGRAYRAVLDKLANNLESEYLLESDFGPRRLFDVHEVVIPAALAALIADESAYDIFISYKRKKHAIQASSLAAELLKRGYRVWFDQYAIDRMQDRPDLFERDHLLAILRNGIQRSECTIIFEAVMEAVLPSPGYTEEDVLAAGLAMRGEQGQLIAWDWHVVEAMTIQRGLGIHDRTIVAFRKNLGGTEWTKRYDYSSETDLAKIVVEALTSFGLRKRRA